MWTDCMCMCVLVCVCVCVRILHAYMGRSKSSPRCQSSGALHLVLRQRLLSWYLPHRRGYLASNHHESFCLQLPWCSDYRNASLCLASLCGHRGTSSHLLKGKHLPMDPLPSIFFSLQKSNDQFETLE